MTAPNLKTTYQFPPAAWLFPALLLAAYLMPWVIARPAALSLGGYDLAEWASLHPQVRASALLITSLLLRMIPALIVIYVTANAQSAVTRAAAGLIVIGVALALLPPLEYFSFAGGDGNYQQQFFVVLVTLAGGAVCLSPLLTDPQRRLLRITSSGLLLLSGIIGAAQGYDLLTKFRLEGGIGAGLILFCTVGGVLLTLELLTLKKQAG